ncbi:NAD(P)-dependent dehydrogenase (short-subunit alcohol dehydrogenase family) [Actinocorallia herbida]|uniref:NAD(P)-dependent dehydrogenase (Short-subunit alcohol dehydrogenase family) n=1 Tax=Actinocorallia herbida TaxID=58109 RepID=A0A3N1CUD1_9ACTN|nr:SDR family oxidoreductase [Actinocorallia herbida]ROO84804.1 NAD(P)-dependent dehydrogenase (short-subunit alcohol dehydrogenase family) [Actinocorallia herbida]
MDHDLKGRTALVTGSTAGIGAAIARALAAEGVHVVVSGRDTARGDAAVAEIRADGGAADFVRADLAGGEEAVAALADRTVALLGTPDILVNNAAMLLMPRPTADLTEAGVAAAFAVSVIAPMLLTGRLAPAMAARGSGAIINLGSINAVTGMPGSAVYSATKAAAHSLTRSWAAEYGPSGVRVNTVAPGPTSTERNERIRDLLDGMVAGIPSRRLSTPAEVASAVVFLAGSAAANVHGTVLAVDGGFTIT